MNTSQKRKKATLPSNGQRRITDPVDPQKLATGNADSTTAAKVPGECL
jgi:hypothetical protein